VPRWMNAKNETTFSYMDVRFFFENIIIRFIFPVKDSWERYERGDPAFVKKPEWKLLAMNAKPGDIQNERLNVLLLKKVPSSLEVIDWKKGKFTGTQIL
jgi:hypothetical protein